MTAYLILITFSLILYIFPQVRLPERRLPYRKLFRDGPSPSTRCLQWRFLVCKSFQPWTNRLVQRSWGFLWTLACFLRVEEWLSQLLLCLVCFALIFPRLTPSRPEHHSKQFRRGLSPRFHRWPYWLPRWSCWPLIQVPWLTLGSRFQASSSE